MKSRVVLVIGLLFIVAGCATASVAAHGKGDPSAVAGGTPAVRDTAVARAIHGDPAAQAARPAPAAATATVDARALGQSDSASSNGKAATAAPPVDRPKYPGVSIKNVAVAERLGFVLKDLSAGEVEALIESKKAGGSTAGGEGNRVAPPTLPNPVLKEKLAEIAARRDRAVTPRENGSGAARAPHAGGAGFKGVAAQNPVRRDAASRIGARTGGVGLWY